MKGDDTDLAAVGPGLETQLVPAGKTVGAPYQAPS